MVACFCHESGFLLTRSDMRRGTSCNSAKKLEASILHFTLQRCQHPLTSTLFNFPTPAAMKSRSYATYHTAYDVHWKFMTDVCGQLLSYRSWTAGTKTALHASALHFFFRNSMKPLSPKPNYQVYRNDSTEY